MSAKSDPPLYPLERTVRRPRDGGEILMEFREKEKPKSRYSISFHEDPLS
jgi:hypothetical protein